MLERPQRTPDQLSTIGYNGRCSIAQILVPGHADIPLLSPPRTPAGMEEWRMLTYLEKSKKKNTISNDKV